MESKKNEIDFNEIEEAIFQYLRENDNRKQREFERIIYESCFKSTKKIDKLLEIIRVTESQFIPTDIYDEHQLIKSLQLIWLVNSEKKEFDDDFFSDIIINKEKIKVLIKWFESVLDYLDRNNVQSFNRYGVSKAIKSVIYFFSVLVPDYKTILTAEEISKISLSNRKKDKRLSEYAPNNNERLKALNEFCPELIKKMHGLDKETKKQIVNLITGVNKEDAYKNLFTANAKKILNETIIQNDEIDIEDLKNKLKNT
jgi:hypothetical protein